MFLQLPNGFLEGTFATSISPHIWQLKTQVSFWEASSWYSRWPAISLATHKLQPWVLHAHSVRWFMHWEILGHLRDGPLVGISTKQAMTRVGDSLNGISRWSMLFKIIFNFLGFQIVFQSHSKKSAGIFSRFSVHMFSTEIHRYRMRPLAHSFPAPNLRRFSRLMAHGRAVAMLTLMGATEWRCNANTAGHTQMPDFDCLQDTNEVVVKNLSLQQRWHERNHVWH